MCYYFNPMQINSSKLILIVDDSKDNQMLLKIILTEKGYQVQCASNGSDALGLLKELSNLPDLILLDARMPVMDGYQFRQEQKKNDRIRNIPVIVMTGESDIEMIRLTMQPEEILHKPLDIKSIIENVAKFS